MSYPSALQPPTDKLHQIIAKTAIFVSKHGGQSEIVLRVKQGDNPTFGFLMPDHHLHQYFRFLVDHKELLQSDGGGKPQNEEKIDTDLGGGNGALSLLGSIYGSGEDDDGATEHTITFKENVSGETVDASAIVSHVHEKTLSSKNNAIKDEAVSKNLLTSKEKAPALRRNYFISGLKSGSTSGTRKEGESFGPLSAATDKLRDSSVSAINKIETSILEPPSEIKRFVDKIVEFIMKNGKQFEAVLMEQDSEHGRFPFLLPPNKYRPYYLQVLQKAQEAKVSGKSSFNEKVGLLGHGFDKKTSVSKGRDSYLLESAGCDIPYDFEKKDKFKMVIGKSKKDGQDRPSKATQQQFGVSVDAAAAAAILQAATRGIRNPNLGFLSSSSLNGNSHEQSGEGGVSMPVVKAIAKTAAIEAAAEADSSEAHLSREQKLKTERLKRAKMFVALLKGGSDPLKPEPLRGLSAEPQESGVSSSAAEVNFASKGSESSSAAALDIDTSHNNEIFEKKDLTDEYNERRARRKYRSRSNKHEEEEEQDDDKDDDEDEDENERTHSRKKRRSHRSSHADDSKEEKYEEEREDKHPRKKHRSYRSSLDNVDEQEDERDHKRSRKKHRTHRSSREEDDEERGRRGSRKKHQSPCEEDEEYAEEVDLRRTRKKHRSPCEEDEEAEEDGDHRHSRKKHRSHRSSHHSRDGHKHRKRHSSSKDRESRQRHRQEICSDEEHLNNSRTDKHRKGSQSEKEELEEGEIRPRGGVGSGPSREASLEMSSSYQDRRTPSQPSETTEVSDDLRAKIRAMLMGTL